MCDSTTIVTVPACRTTLDDLTCIFCKQQFVKWYLLKRHLEHHVISAQQEPGANLSTSVHAPSGSAYEAFRTKALDDRNVDQKSTIIDIKEEVIINPEIIGIESTNSLQCHQNLTCELDTDDPEPKSYPDNEVTFWIFLK